MWPLLGREQSNAFLENSVVGTVHCWPLELSLWFLGSMFALTGEEEVIISLKHCLLSNYVEALVLLSIRSYYLRNPHVRKMLESLFEGRGIQGLRNHRV